VLLSAVTLLSLCDDVGDYVGKKNEILLSVPWNRRRIEVDPVHPSPENNGKLVVAAGDYPLQNQLEDEYLKSAHYLVLNRHVEMFQWIRKKGSTVWSQHINLAGLRGSWLSWDPRGHENPLLKVAREN